MVLVTMIIFFALAIYLVYRMFNLQTERKRKRGFSYLVSLRECLEYVQKHRGLALAYVSGNEKVKTDIIIYQKKVKEHIIYLNNVSEDFVGNSRWVGIQEHWQRLAERYMVYDKETNFNQHNMMVKNIIYLIEDVFLTYDLISVKGSKENIDQYLSQILYLIEFMGQARAIGSSIAAIGQCGSVDRIRMNYLLHKIELNFERLNAKEAGGEQFYECVNGYVDTIKTKVLPPFCLIEVAEYFNVATSALDAVYRLLDSQLNTFFQEPTHR